MNPHTLALDLPARSAARSGADLGSCRISIGADRVAREPRPARSSFLVVDPRLWVPGYTLRSAALLAAAGLRDPEKLLPLVILNIQADPLQVTANLLGPLAVDPESGQGAQVVVTDQPYSAEQPVTFLEQRIHLRASSVARIGAASF